jgi:hypothetical protein
MKGSSVVVGGGDGASGGVLEALRADREIEFSGCLPFFELVDLGLLDRRRTSWYRRCLPSLLVVTTSIEEGRDADDDGLTSAMQADPILRRSTYRQTLLPEAL